MIIFLYDVESNYEIKDEDLELGEALTEFYELSDEMGTFFGIQTDNGLIQFAWEDEDKWLVEVPNDSKNRKFLQRFATYDECVEIIKSIFEGVLPVNIKGLVHVKIMEETLSTVLANKKA